ncbi:MAG: hypothetical protein NXI00_02665 [Cytophagales bacterium]|nr:hypothetical protein [Cytophagales bacterium]
MILYEFENAEIKIWMRVYFDPQNQLKFEGYDIGKRVNELLGDSDYEYFYTVEAEEVKKLAKLFNVSATNKEAILRAIKKRFHNNDAYSKFGQYMKENEIKFSQFTWS